MSLPSRKLLLDLFLCIYSPQSCPEVRKRAHTQLLQLESDALSLVPLLFTIYEEPCDPGIRFQVIIYASNVLKRQWTLRRSSKAHSGFDELKRQVRKKMLIYLERSEKIYRKTLFDLLKFLCLADYPHAYPEFTIYLRGVLASLSFDDASVLTFKAIRQIFLEMAARKGTLSKKHYEQNLVQPLATLCFTSANFLKIIESGQPVEKQPIKISKYCDQIILSIMRMAPIDILDSEIAPQIVTFMMGKLRALITRNANSPSEVLLEKNIKSLIYSLGQLQVSKPLGLSWVLADYFEVLVYVLNNGSAFPSPTPLRYALLGIRKLIREFAYYAEEATFNSAIRSKHMSANCLHLRVGCLQFYRTAFSQNAIESILSTLLTSVMCMHESQRHFESEEWIDKQNELQLSVASCAIMLVDALLERFPVVTHGLIGKLIHNCLSNGWTGVDTQVQASLMSVVALLPNSIRKQSSSLLGNFPILQILNYAFTNPTLKIRIPTMVSGWIHFFADAQLNTLAHVFLDYIMVQTDMELLLSCCQCLSRILSERFAALNLPTLVQKVLPACLAVCEKTNDPSLLWPVVQLVSNTLIRAQVGWEALLQCINASKITAAISNESPMLIEAFCEMFKNFLCVIPRNHAAPAVFQLIALFLDQHLSCFELVVAEKVLHLWYVAIREYSSVQQSHQLYTALFHTHFRRSLFRKSPTLVYILEEYLLAGLINTNIADFMLIVRDFYAEAESLEKDEREQLKIATLSFQITLLTNPQLLLECLFKDFLNSDPQEVSGTLRNSILSILNRLILMHYPQFLNLLAALKIPQEVFFEAYFASMKHLTSRNSMKINAITVTSLLPHLPPPLLRNNLLLLLQSIIPEVEHFGTQGEQGKVANSPSLRFASNVLSDRKEQVRRKGCFEHINLPQFFRQQLKATLMVLNTSAQEVAQMFTDQSWGLRLMQVC